jgi:hypothetical protein
MSWQYSGTSQKSGVELDRLARLLSHPLYNPQDLIGFSHSREDKQLDKYLESKDTPFQAEYGWRKSSIKIRLPKESAKYSSESNAPQIRTSVMHPCDHSIFSLVINQNMFEASRGQCHATMQHIFER